MSSIPTAFTNAPHRRFNALTGEWVFVSPQRTQRPWQGRVESVGVAARPAHDPGCYLCLGNLRAGGERNPNYTGTFVFTNDYPAFQDGSPGLLAARHRLLLGQAHSGECRVVCFSPRHDLTLAQLPIPELRGVIDTWVVETQRLSERWRWVQVFENKGELMGCSNPHPHGQIWAGDFVPNEAVRELRQQQDWFASHGRPLLLDYAELELDQGERIVVETTHWLAVVPWWAIWPFETLILPRRAVARVSALSVQERDDLAVLLNRVLTRYDNLFETSFPYSFGWHGAPNEQGADIGWQLHAHFYPPLLRSAGVKKFMVGYEMLAEAQRDLTPEQAAARLRELSDIHYLSTQTVART